MWIQAVAVILPRVQQHFDGEPSFRLFPLSGCVFDTERSCNFTSVGRADRFAVIFHVWRNDVRSSGLGNL